MQAGDEWHRHGFVQAFRYAGRAAEIAVYLKRRMGIEQIRIGSPVLSAFIGGGVELFGNQFIGVITSSSRAHRQTFHPIDQPVEWSPRAISDFLAASKRTGEL